jgi:hypothetical protein
MEEAPSILVTDSVSSSCFNAQTQRAILPSNMECLHESLSPQSHADYPEPLMTSVGIDFRASRQRENTHFRWHFNAPYVSPILLCGLDI